MRTIKFRGKCLDGKGWIRDSYTLIQDGDGTWLHDNDVEKIDENTLGQFTGLYDKNGKEIYEGDIVKTKEYGIDIHNGESNFNVVGYDNFLVDYIDGRFILSNNLRRFLLCRGNHLEIIGNIFDNKDLMKVENHE